MSYSLRGINALKYLFLLIGFGISLTCAQSAHTSPVPNTELAYFVGYHTEGHENVIYNVYPQGYYTTRVYYRTWSNAPRFQWTRWKDIGCSSRSRCLIDTFTGIAVRCERSRAY